MRVTPFAYLEQKDEAAPSVVVPAHYIFTVAGTSYDGTTINRIAKVLSDGSIDSTFNTGMTGVSLSNADYAGTTDGDFLYFGGADGSGNIKVFKVSATDGTLSATSSLTFNGSIFGAHVFGNYVYVTGTFTNAGTGSTARIARLNKSDLSDANTTTLFGVGFNNATFGKAIAFTSTHVYIAGTFTNYNSGANTGGLVKLQLSDGSYDTTFATNWGNATNNIRGMDLYNGILYMGGFNSTNGYVYSVDTSGNANSTFNTGVGTGFNGRIRDVVVNQKGQIGFQGQYTSFDGTGVNAFTVLDTDGSINSTFNGGSGTEMGGSTNGRCGWNSEFDTWVVGKTATGGFSWDGSSVNANAFINEDGTLNSTLTGTSVVGQVTFNNAPNPNELLRT